VLDAARPSSHPNLVNFYLQKKKKSSYLSNGSGIQVYGSVWHQSNFEVFREYFSSENTKVSNTLRCLKHFGFRN
jgi:hypothetical protein